MEPEKEVKFFNLIREFNRQQIRYLIIGRRAVILYGGPVLTADHDLWIHPADKKKILSLLLEKFGFELSHPPDTKRPIVTSVTLNLFQGFVTPKVIGVRSIILT